MMKSVLTRFGVFIIVVIGIFGFFSTTTPVHAQDNWIDLIYNYTTGKAGANEAASVKVQAPNPADAGGGILPPKTGKCPEDYQNGTAPNLSQGCKDGAERDYALDDIKSLLARIGNLMLGVSGAIVLFCFVLGGFFWIASAGNPKMVDKGKTLITSAVIGLIIMFSAYTVVVFGVRTLVGSDAYKPGSAGPVTSPSGSAGQAATVKKGTVTNISLPYSAVGLCEKIGSGGSCSPVNTCKSSYAIIGACGTAGVADPTQECCMPMVQPSQTTGCGKIGGVCQATSKSCNGAYVAGLCGTGNSNQCCFKAN